MGDARTVDEDVDGGADIIESGDYTGFIAHVAGVSGRPVARIRDQACSFLEFASIQVEEVHDCSMFCEPFRNREADSAGGARNHRYSPRQT